MGTRISALKLYVFIVSLALASHLFKVAHSSKVWDEVPFPEDLEEEDKRPGGYVDDEEYYEASGDINSGDEDGSTPEPITVDSGITIYYRALVNFTNSFRYGPELDDIFSPAFLEISSAVVDTLESDYNTIPGIQTVNVVLIKNIGKDVFVELDVGSDNNFNETQIRGVLYSVVKDGTIASYDTSVVGFQFRRLGEVKPRECLPDEFTCQDGGCVRLEYVCDNRPDCNDLSDEVNCFAGPRPPTPPTPPRTRPPPGPGPCRADQATCQNGQCISRDYVCDGEQDCNDGSDELRCGTPSPCEPNEFKCQNGRCALKLWRCDGDNDCQDNSDESDCPTKGPGDRCAPEQFACLSDRTCIPASYQCDEEPDCPDRSDEYGCAPPTVTVPPEESITVSRGDTVTFTCTAIGVPTPIITWRLNWGHLPVNNRVTMTSENGRGTLTIRDVKEGDQGAYTCEAINAKGLVFAIPDGILSLSQRPNPVVSSSLYVLAGNCRDGHFSLGDHCMPCFCFGITKNCQSTGRYRSQIPLRFSEEEDFKGVNVTFPSRPGTPPPLSSTQMLINPETEEFQLVDLSRRFLDQDSYWSLPRQFLGNKVDSYGGYLKYKVSYSLQRGGSEPKEKPDVVLSGNGHRFIYLRGDPTYPDIINHREIKFTEENWHHTSGGAVTRDDLMMLLANLESIQIRTIYDNRMASIGLSDISMDTTTKEYSLQGNPRDVEECRCPPGYSGLSCETCSPAFERVPGPYLGTCAGCNCNGHASACDPASGHCLRCQHNTEGPQCNKCKLGYFGDPSRGRYDDCKPCPCPYTETSRRFSDTCFLDHDKQATCDACRTGYTGRRCEKCAPGYVGNPLKPNGKCIPDSSPISKCDNRGTINPISRPCYCKANVVGALCDECKSGAYHLSADNPDGCLQCFCMGVTKLCASSSWSRDQVRGGVNGQLFTLSNAANTRTISEGIIQRASTEIVYRSFSSIPNDIYYWVLPENFGGDKVTAYGGELQYQLRFELQPRSLVIEGQSDVVLQGSGIFLEYYSQIKPLPRVPTTMTVSFRESAWRRSDGLPCTREHLLMALADISVFMIRATYGDNMAESSISNIQMDIAVPHSTGSETALEVEECACPQGYTGPSCQDCEVGYTRTPGLYLGTCQKCDCNGHASGCDLETGECLNCLHNTDGRHCENCCPGFYGNPKSSDAQACRPCPCLGQADNQRTCFVDTDGQPTCECPTVYTGRRCERCATGYIGNPQLGQRCTLSNNNGDCYRCDQSGSEGCSSTGVCRCKMNVEGSTCSICKQGTFHLSPSNKDGCLSCFCMGVTQQCSSSNHYRDLVSTTFTPGSYQGFALVNRQRTNRIDSGFSVELSTEGTQLSYTNFNYLGQEPHYWQLPNHYQGDKKAHSARIRRAQKHPADEARKLDDEIWAIISNVSNGRSPFFPSLSSQTPGAQSARSGSSVHATSFHSGLTSSLTDSGSQSADTDQSYQPDSSEVENGKNTVGTLRGPRPGPSNKYVLVYNGFSLHQDDVLFWKLPEQFKEDKVGAYGGKLKYTISYVPGPRGSPIEDADVQIIGNDITLVARQPWRRSLGARESKHFEIIFREEHWQRPDGMPATREHLMMVLADLDDILIRASYHTEMRSSSISGVRMDIAVPNYTGLAQALEVEQCQCPPGYRGLSCQDCAAGYTRTGGGLYLGHCEPCECNGHSDSCQPESGICTNCQHNTKGELCEQCADGFFGDPTAGTPEDCQPCACPGTDPDNQFSRTCESLGNGGYQCTACQPGYTGQYCERCAPGYVGNPQARVPCRSAAASLVVKVYPERVQVAQGNPVTLRCQVSGYPPHHFYWSLEDGRPISSTAEKRRQGEELHFPSVHPGDAGVYICTCRDQHSTNRSKAEIVVTTLPSKPIEVFIEEPKTQSVTVGATVSFICTAKSKLPAYTLVWTRRGNGKLPNRAMDFNGILTIQNVQPEDAGIYVCTGSNMLGMDEGSALLYVPAAEGVQPVASINPPVLTVHQGQRAEFRCTGTGNPTPAVEWTGGPGKRISPRAVIRNGLLTIPSVERSDEGEYICKALNTHGEHTARGVLHVQSTNQANGLPHVQVSPPSVEIHEGETLRLYCRAVGIPTPGLKWKKRGGSLPPQAISSHGFHQFKSNSLDVLQRRIAELQALEERTDTGTLLIPNIRSSDAGTYLCVGTNTVGSSEAYIEVFVKRGEIIPSGVTIQPSIASVAEGETLDLNCIVPGTSPASVKWSRAGGLLSSNHQVFGTRLRILQASSDDSGEYICHVENGPSSYQASVSVSVTSSASRLQSPIISIEPHTAAVKQGDSASFRCRVHSGEPPVRLEWKPTNNQPLPDNVKTSPDNSVITFSNAQAKNQGTYRCVASNLFGITHSIVSLIVKESPKAVVTPTGPVRVRVGDPINLECQAAGEPRPSVRWHRLDNNRRTILSSPVPADSNAVMQILVARPEDTGTYVCTAQNNRGTTETRIDVLVEGGAQIPTVPRASVREPMIFVVEGSTATLHCDAHGFPKPTITWSKERSSLPWRHKIVDNSLILPNVGRQDSGQYVCNATNHMGISEVTVMLEVDTPPYATSLPDDVSVRVGEVIRLQCMAHGTPPLRFEWSKVNGSLPSTAQVQGGDLQINLATENDAGSYKCVSSNNVGRSEAFAKVSVRSPLSVKVSPQVEVKAPGSAVEFTCAAKGGHQIEIEWLREGGILPPNHHIYNGVLRIENLEQSNEGIYTCRASSLFGQAQDSAKLSIQALPKVMINVRTSVQTVMVGNSVEFECHAVGDPEPSVRWSKVGGSLPDHVVVKGHILRIEQVTEADAGQYRCTATNNVGSVQSQVALNIQSLPQIAAQPETKEVTVGSDAIFPCIASGYPVPTITWSKEENELPPKCRQDGHVLTVPAVTHSDAGTYVCTAANKQGKVEAFTRLNVHERVMPYFTQEPLSYLTLPTIKNSYNAFSIKITFRPDNVDGLILYAGMIIYNGQKKTSGADFISFGLVGGRPEFRFDVGSGMATIRYPTAIKLGEFHTVELYRNLTHGSLVVDGEAPVNGTSQGKFKGLDLNEELFVGGYPNYTMLAKTAGLKTGFVGCMKQLTIQGDEVIFKDLDKSSTGVSNCPTCKDSPCQHGAVCEDSVASLYKCKCQRGYTGSNCQHHSSLHCHTEACGPDATCINRPNGSGYDCRCHLGKSGDKCMAGTLVTTPLFDGEDSYIAYPPLTNIHNDLRIEMVFKPLDPDGLMFFSGGKKMKVEDFVAVSMVNGHVEFRYELGTGQAILRSQEPLSLRQWHRVVAERLDKDGSLKVDNAREITRSSPGKAQGLNIHTPMYLGGVPSMDILPKPANVSMLFAGCIGEVFINGKKMDLSYSFIVSRAISQCKVDSPCDHRPCMHGGTCMASFEYEYQCLCPEGYEGERCETVKDACRVSSQCQNGGSCVNNHCVCPAGYTGRYCEKGQESSFSEQLRNLEGSGGNDSPIQHSAYFHDNGYLALPKPMFPRSDPDSPETIEFEINTVSRDGLILWQGVETAGALSVYKNHASRKELGDQGKGKDFISLGLQNGRVVFSYQLGSGEARIESRVPVNDGHWHKISAVRTNKHGYIQIDGGFFQRGQSQGNSVMVNTKGIIYLGGAPDMKSLTGGKFSSGITGCVRNLSLTNAGPGEQPARPIDLQVHAEEGINVERCST
ncbi:basement membrane-specific heparan sulfate proteoglycan core protein isoform X6 [Triplophysa rosa]|uniref:basement membrane-specific heparan sulfate proteoglycan core protein isoform X6 n=1 Tax=Triplophysa rosa TaxID=992332 RepID=UPI002545ED6C|nr:basement membrane-specific heparan sulfate proteoglycan core protein isoform X6 [Triplophysa rosa]